MKLILAVVKPFRAQSVLEAIGEHSVDTALVCEARGLGRQKDQLPHYVGSEFSPVQLPKIELALLAEDAVADPLIDCIANVARTGRIGDGKIVVLNVEGEIDL